MCSVGKIEIEEVVEEKSRRYFRAYASMTGLGLQAIEMAKN